MPNATASGISFNDGLSYLNPSDFAGTFSMTGANFGAGVVFGYTAVQLGSNLSDVSSLPSLSIGFDASVGGFEGQSIVKSVTFLKCDCN
jgi:hypothetical protein